VNGSGASGNGANGNGANGQGGFGDTGSSSGGATFLPSGGTGNEADASCVGVVGAAEQVSLDMYMMYDQSLSMECAVTSTFGGPTRWDTTKQAVDAFLGDPGANGIGVGIGYFGNNGLTSSCNAADYTKPDVEIAPLPGNANNVANSINGKLPSTDTPTLAALQGAIQHATDWKNQHPGHTTIVVLVTDGEPNACGSVQDVANAAAQGLNNGIATYVIGITSPGVACGIDPNPPNQADLDTVAKAGGSDHAFIVNASQNAAQTFVDAMNKIRGSAQVPCEYQLPPPPAGEQLNFQQVNVKYSNSTGTSSVYYVKNQSGCDATRGGWYYDNDPDPPTSGTPTKILLCPTTCNTVTTDVTSKVDVQVGCGIQVLPM
jgi:hypothetical protein